MVLAVEEDVVYVERTLVEWRCGGTRPDGRRCTTLICLHSVDFIGRLERRCPDCKEVKVRER